MTNLSHEQKKVQKAMNASLSGLQEDPWLAQRILNHESEEPVVKKKFSAGLVLLILLLLLTTAGIAVVRSFGILDYTPHQTRNKAYTEKIMTLDQQWEGEYFSAVIHEAIFDGMKMTFTMSIDPKEGADPVYVIPYIRAMADDQPLSLWVMGGNGGFSDDGFWVPDIMPEFGYDYTGWAVDVALSEDMKTFAPVAEEIEWEIDFHVLHTDWPIRFTEEDEPGIDEPEWTDADYAVYEQQFVEAYRNRQLLLNRAGMFGSYLYAIDETIDELRLQGMSWNEIVENTLTREVFTLVETASFRFRAKGATVKTNRDPVTFQLPENYCAELISLDVSVDQIGVSLRITRSDGEKAEYHDFQWDFALLADGAQTMLEASSMGGQDDGSILYTARMSIDGETDRLTLIPVLAEERVAYPPDENGYSSSSSMQQAVMKNGAPLTKEQEQMKVVIELQ